MSNARIRMLSAIAAIALASQAVMAHGLDGDENCRHERSAMYGDYMGPGIGKRLADRLGLSPEQKQALEDIADKHRTELRELRDSILDSGRALGKSLADDPRLHELAAAEGKAIADMIVLRKQIRAEVDKVLTDPQREKLEMLRRQARHHGRDGNAWHDR